VIEYGRATAIAGIGATEFSKNSGRTPMQLATEACVAACVDAGLDPSEVDGIVTYSAEKNTDIEVARNLGVDELTHFSMIPHGGGAAAGAIAQAAMALYSGAARYVLCIALSTSGRGTGSGRECRTSTRAPRRSM
jgi:3-oxoacyl-[acyl-carrier-protein] synthase III